jgi:NADH-quinone oxidoreductase subunit D
MNVKLREVVKSLRKNFGDNAKLLIGNTIWMKRTEGIGYLDLAGCTTLGITGPVLRSAGLPWDLRKMQPYCGYENYEFDVITADTADVYGRFLVRMAELEQSLRIIEQAIDKLDKLEGQPVMVADKKIAWPAQLALGADGLGNSLDHIREIMGTSMESLIHHFKLVTEGFRVPAGQVYVSVESPRGELAAHVVSDGGTRPYRVHFREPSFNNLQSTSAMSEGGMVADIIGAVASIDPVMGGVDR